MQESNIRKIVRGKYFIDYKGKGKEERKKKEGKTHVRAHFVKVTGEKEIKIS